MGNTDERDVTRKSGVVYAAVFSLIMAVVTLLLIGLALDKWLKTTPWLLVAGTVLGTIVGFYQFIRVMSRLS